MSLYEEDTYEAIIIGDVEEGEWITIAEDLTTGEELPSYLMPVQDHELNRMEAEILEAEELSDSYYREMYGRTEDQSL